MDERLSWNRPGRGGVVGAMKLRTSLLGLAALILAACQAPGATGSPPTASLSAVRGIEGLVGDLRGAGVDAKAGGQFMSEPIGGQGAVVCIGPESVQTYQFIEHEAALAAAAKIDRQDPSKVGTGIVDWAGTPRFWLRENLIVLYLGQDPGTDTALRTLLGQPFAQGQPGRPPLLGGPDCQ